MANENSYLKRGFEISFEVDKAGVLCRMLSSTININATGENWIQAFEVAHQEIKKIKVQETTDD